jgi:hypothetical protein
MNPKGLARVDEIMRDALGTVCPAATLLVARHGHVALHRACGYLDPDRRQRTPPPGASERLLPARSGPDRSVIGYPSNSCTPDFICP